MTQFGSLIDKMAGTQDNLQAMILMTDKKNEKLTRSETNAKLLGVSLET